MRACARASAERCGDIWASERLPKGKTINIFPINCLILSPESTRKCFLRPCACARSLRWSLVTKRTELYAAICVRRFLGVGVVRVSLNCYFSRVSELIVALFFWFCLLWKILCLANLMGRIRSPYTRTFTKVLL